MAVATPVRSVLKLCSSSILNTRFRLSSSNSTESKSGSSSTSAAGTRPGSPKDKKKPKKGATPAAKGGMARKELREVPVLFDINLNVRKGELVGVCGGVGSGKSSLLSAIIGEMKVGRQLRWI